MALARSCTFQASRGIIRFYPSQADSSADYTAVAHAAVYGAVLVLEGLNGALSRRNLRDLCAVAIDHGCRYIYAKRLPHRLLPFGTLISTGAWAGWTEIDLQDATLTHVLRRSAA